VHIALAGVAVPSTHLALSWSPYTAMTPVLRAFSCRVDYCAEGISDPSAKYGVVAVVPVNHVEGNVLCAGVEVITERNW